MIEKILERLEKAFPVNPYPNEFTNGRNLGIKKAIEIVKEVAKEYEGRVIELPCKVGDKVWFIRTSNIKPELVETEIEKVVLKKRGLYVQLSCNSFYETSCNSIGKTVFFTEAEAEEALAKMGGK